MLLTCFSGVLLFVWGIGVFFGFFLQAFNIALKAYSVYF